MEELLTVLAGAAAGWLLLQLAWINPTASAQALILRIFAAANAPLLVLDAAGRVEAASPSASELLPPRPGGLEGAGLDEILPGARPALRDGLPEVVEPLSGGGARPVLELRPMDLGLGGRRLVFIRDLSAQRWAEAARVRDERFYRSLLEHTMGAIAVLDRSGEVLYHSPSKGSPTPLGPQVLRSMPPDDQARWGGLLSRLAERPGRTEGFAFVARDGRRFQGMVLFSTALERPGYIVNYRDASLDAPKEA